MLRDNTLKLTEELRRMAESMFKNGGIKLTEEVRRIAKT